ncbi:putative membrane protein [Clostridium bornimense]|uniref:Putative membrane protein n=1 Tax=Clostridium bornimense TaxID=1216932 RepID=W6S163_9CLOT|nr:putative membrane protein [Clostridium bornimense]
MIEIEFYCENNSIFLSIVEKTKKILPNDFAYYYNLVKVLFFNINIFIIL